MTAAEARKLTEENSHRFYLDTIISPQIEGSARKGLRERTCLVPNFMFRAICDSLVNLGYSLGYDIKDINNESRELRIIW